MYRCDQCDHIFEKAEACPVCGSDNYTDVCECSVCGAIFESKQERYGACPKCNDYIIKRFESFVNSLTTQQRAALEEYLEQRHTEGLYA